MAKACPNCGEKVKFGNKFCSKNCSDKNKLQTKINEVTSLKKEVHTLKQRVEEQDNLWENLVCDIAEGSDSSATIRWWKNKLVQEYNVSAQSRMINWLNEIATIIDVYGEVKNYQKST